MRLSAPLFRLPCEHVGRAGQLCRVLHAFFGRLRRMRLSYVLRGKELNYMQSWMIKKARLARLSTADAAILLKLHPDFQFSCDDTIFHEWDKTCEDCWSAQVTKGVIMEDISTLLWRPSPFLE